MPLPCSPVSHSAPSSEASYSQPPSQSPSSDEERTQRHRQPRNPQFSHPFTRPQAQEEAEEAEEAEEEEEDSDDSLTTPRAGPADPKLRTVDNLSRPSLPVSASTSPGRAEGERFPWPGVGAGRGKGKGKLEDREAGRTTSSVSTSAAAVQGKREEGKLSRAASAKSVTFLPSQTQTPAAGVTGSSPRQRPASWVSSSSSGLGRQSPELRTKMAGGDGYRDGEGGGESSADENTAIFRRGSGGVRGVGAAGGGYGALGGEGEYDGAGEEDMNWGGARRRKGGAGGSGAGSSLRGKSAGAGGRGSVQGDAQVSGREREGDDASNEQEGWFKSLIDKYGSVELENKGSVARDHLALERTFLAWLRTSLAFASIGIAITQLFRLNTSLNEPEDQVSVNTAANLHSTSSSLLSSSLLEQRQVHEHAPPFANEDKLRQVGKPLGATFLGISILILLLGFHRYFEAQHYVIRGKFPASRGSIVLVSLLACALIVASLVVVVVVAPGAFAAGRGG